MTTTIEELMKSALDARRVTQNAIGLAVREARAAEWSWDRISVALSGSLSGLTRRALLQLVSTEPTPFVVGQAVAVVAAGGVEPDSRHPRRNGPSQANPDREEVTAEPLADVVGQQSEGVYLDLTARWHVQGEQPCWFAVDECHPVPQVRSPR